jgi:hypothetical protein
MDSHPLSILRRIGESDVKSLFHSFFIVEKRLRMNKGEERASSFSTIEGDAKVLRRIPSERPEIDPIENGIMQLADTHEGECTGFFLLTLSDGARYYIYWRGYMSKVDDSAVEEIMYLQKIFFAASAFSFPTFMLDVFRILELEDPSRLPLALHRLTELPILAGFGLQYRIQMAHGELRLNFSPHMDKPLDAGIATVAVAFLNAKLIILLWEAMLLEKKILIKSEYRQIVSAVCEFLLRLVHPYTYVYSYIPLLPLEGLEMVEAPGAYLVGCISSELDNRVSLDLSDTLVIDVDAQEAFPPARSHSLVPTRLKQSLYWEIRKDLVAPMAQWSQRVPKQSGDACPHTGHELLRTGLNIQQRLLEVNTCITCSTSCTNPALYRDIANMEKRYKCTSCISIAALSLTEDVTETSLTLGDTFCALQGSSFDPNTVQRMNYWVEMDYKNIYVYEFADEFPIAACSYRDVVVQYSRFEGPNGEFKDCVLDMELRNSSQRLEFHLLLESGFVRIKLKKFLDSKIENHANSLVTEGDSPHEDVLISMFRSRLMETQMVSYFRSRIEIDSNNCFAEKLKATAGQSNHEHSLNWEREKWLGVDVKKDLEDIILQSNSDEVADCGGKEKGDDVPKKAILHEIGLLGYSQNDMRTFSESFQSHSKKLFIEQYMKWIEKKPFDKDGPRDVFSHLCDSQQIVFKVAKATIASNAELKPDDNEDEMAGVLSKNDGLAWFDSLWAVFFPGGIYDTQMSYSNERDIKENFISKLIEQREPHKDETKERSFIDNVIATLIGHLYQTLNAYDDALKFYAQGLPLYRHLSHCIVEKYMDLCVNFAQSDSAITTRDLTWFISELAKSDEGHGLLAYRLVVSRFIAMENNVGSNSLEKLTIHTGYSSSSSVNGQLSQGFSSPDAMTHSSSSNGLELDHGSSENTGQISKQPSGRMGSGRTPVSQSENEFKYKKKYAGAVSNSFTGHDVLNETVVCTESRADPCLLSARLLSRLRELIRNEIVFNSGDVNSDDTNMSGGLLNASAYGPAMDCIRASSSFKSFTIDCCQLQKVDGIAQMTDREKFLFWINIYNLLMAHAMIATKPPPSRSWNRYHYMKNQRYNIGGLHFNLIEIEHGILRANLSKPLIGGAFSISLGFKSDEEKAAKSACALSYLDRSFSRPEVLRQVSFVLFTACDLSPPLIVFHQVSTIEEELNKHASSYLHRHLRIDDGGPDSSRSTVYLPTLMKFYLGDFGKVQRDLVEYARQLTNNPWKSRLGDILDGSKEQGASNKSPGGDNKKPVKLRVEFIEWDWSPKIVI